MTPRNKILARLITIFVAATLAFSGNAKATLIWKLDIKECPSCRHPVAQKIYASKNTFGARYWSDGKMEKDGYDNDLAFVECPRCGSAFWIEKAKHIGEVDVLSKPDRDKIIRSEKKVSKRYPYDNVAPYLIPSEDNWYRAINDRNYRDGGEERYLRVHAWWSSNDRYRNPGVRNQPARKAREWENMAVLFKMLKADTQQVRLMKAEPPPGKARSGQTPGLLRDQSRTTLGPLRNQSGLSPPRSRSRSRSRRRRDRATRRAT